MSALAGPARRRQTSVQHSSRIPDCGQRGHELAGPLWADTEGDGTMDPPNAFVTIRNLECVFFLTIKAIRSNHPN